MIKVITGEQSATSAFLALSNSLWDSDLKWKVVSLLWFVEASTLTLNLCMMPLVTSPSVVGRPSFPAHERSISWRMKDSVTPDGLIRGLTLQAEVTGWVGVDEVGEGDRDGKAS